MRSKKCVIMLGTDPRNPKGGVGFAMPGYREALELEGLLYSTIPTYRPGSLGGKFLPALLAIGPLVASILRLRFRGQTPIVYGHAGQWPAIVREGMLLAFCRLLGARTILQLHSLHVHRYLDTRVGLSLMRVVGALTNRLLVVTPWWQERLAQKGLQSTVVPNPLPRACEAIARQAAGARSDGQRLRVLSMTRLVPGKGIEVVIEAIAKVGETFELTIAGDGPIRKQLEVLARERGIADRVHFPGWVDEQAKHGLLAATDVFCLPSVADSFGMVFLEAMAHGVPVIALNWGPREDVVPPDKAGLLVSEQSPDSVAQALLKMQDANFRRALGDYGRQYVLETFSISSLSRRLRAVVTCLLGPDC